VPFTVGGIESDDSGTVSFSDGSHPAVVVNITNGAPAATTANLAGLNDGTITATLHLNNDAAGNSFTNVITNATLDQDKVTEIPKVSAPAKLTEPAGGSTQMGIVLTAVDSDDTLSVSIGGVPAIESVTAAGATPTITKQGSTSTYTFNSLPSADWNNGLILNSTYAGKGHPTNTLTVTASNTTAGESAAASSVSIAVTDPPISASPNGSTNLSDLIAQFSAGIGSSRSEDAGPTLGLLGGGLLASGSIPDIATLTEHFMGGPFMSGGASGLLSSSPTSEEQRVFLAFNHG
jgi:hypothetical protein